MDAFVISRRGLLTSAAATASLAALPVHRAAAAEATNLTFERKILEVNGKPASVFRIARDNGASGLVLDPGQRFDVQLRNRSDEPTIIHWHGQTPPTGQDGEAETGIEMPIASHDDKSYSFVPRPGTHWMHSHQGLQEQLQATAPMIIRRPADVKADAQEIIVLLEDFSFRDPREILAGLTGAHAASSMPGMHGMSGMSGMAATKMNAMPMGSGQPSAGMDLNDVEFDAYLANDRTLADPLVARVERGGFVRLRLINGASSTAFWIDLGTLEGKVLEVDGDPVQPVTVRRFPMSQAQRVDVLLQLPQSGGAFPIFALREGDRQRTGLVLATQGAIVGKLAMTADSAAPAVDLSLERQLIAVAPLTPRKPDRVHQVVLEGGMMPYVWRINGKVWAEHKPLAVTLGERVALDLVNRTHMAHPMHLHGHHFQVVELNGRPINGTLRDTVLVPPMETVRVAFDADNAGRWLFHCHNLYHMATGMMTEIAYT